MNEQDALRILLNDGARDCIYADEFEKLHTVLKEKFIDLHRFCKQQGARNIRDWLISQHPQ